MKAAIAALAVLLSATSVDPVRDYHGRSMDGLCRSFVEWQRIMKAEGYPPEAYAKTGMERHCPGMV
jgi:hypothetical protein